MPLPTLRLKPGMYSDDTDRDVGSLGYWKDGDKVRFLHGLPQSMGGWVKDDASASMVGTARSAVDWITSRMERAIGLGTSKKLYVWIDGGFFDITPIRASSTINNNPFAMTDTSTTVVVTDTSHGAIDGAYVTYSGAAAAGGITISGEYRITYIDADSYSITHSAAATSTVSGGGASVVAAYQINPGLDTSVFATGWGVGNWGEETWGTPRALSDVIDSARVWSLSAWGEDLIASHVDGNIYVWDSSVGTGTRAALIATAPTSNKSVLVSSEDRHVIALGAGGDPMLIQWCDSEDYNDWTPTTTNTAGDKRVDRGNTLMRGVDFRNTHLIFTDAAMYNMRFIGPPYTFSVEPVGATGGLMGPNAVVVYAEVCYWMGTENFYFYDGTIQVLPCPVFETVFKDFNFAQGAKVWAGANSRFDEVWWLYCSEGSDEVDRYVLYSTVEKHWAFGTIARTVYVGDSDVIGEIYAVSADGFLYYHDTGTTADGSAMNAYLESGDIEIAPDGEQFMHISKLIPDFKRLTGEVVLTVTTKRYPQDTESQSSAALTVNSNTKFVNPRVRGRQASIRVESNSTTADWRMGTMRVELRPHGKR